MYLATYHAIQNLSKGQRAELKRYNLQSLADAPAYFRLIATAKLPDTRQSQRIIFLLLHTDLAEEGEGDTVAKALLKAGVKENQVIQLTRSGDNGIDYLKRQLVRCSNINLESLGNLAQFWGDRTRRQLLKEFIFAQTEKYESESTIQEKE